MVEAFFGFKKTPFGDSPDPKQLFPSLAWNQVKGRLQLTKEAFVALCGPRDRGSVRGCSRKAARKTRMRTRHLPATPNAAQDGT